jgi:N utilization substance protein B
MSDKKHEIISPEFGLDIDKLDSAGESPTHSRRVGRELTMQYLFQRDLSQPEEMPPMELFFEQTIAASEIITNRYTRKGCDYASKLINGINANQVQIDELIQTNCRQWSLERMSSVDKNIMRVAVYEMLFEEAVPPVVSINEAVAIARDYSGVESGNFINGILNGIMVKTLTRSQRKGVKKA